MHGGEYSYNSTLSLTSALDGGGGVIKVTPRRFTPRKVTRYPFNGRLCEPQRVAMLLCYLSYPHPRLARMTEMNHLFKALLWRPNEETIGL
jgi:hypothetical protein